MEEVKKNSVKQKKPSKVTSKENKPKALKMLFTIVPRGKKEVFIDLIEKYQANIQMSFYGVGTASNDIVSLLGIDTKEKDVIISILREDLVNDCILELDDKLKTLKKSNGIAFAVPFESIIGNKNYLFMANLRSESHGK